MNDVNQIRDAREAILKAIPSETSNFGEEPPAGGLYIPRAHVKALKLESSLVVGARGVGKSFWTSALNSKRLQKILIGSAEELKNTRVRIGFAVSQNIAAYPDRGTFTELIKKHNPYQIWQGVILRWLSKLIKVSIPQKNWNATTEWIKSNPEPVAKYMEMAKNKLLKNDEKGLIVFDALDRSSNDWKNMDDIVRGLLEVTLWLKSFHVIHAKVFLRDDQFSRTVMDFPDASKLLATKSELTWQPHDLHGLLWQLLCNAPGDSAEVLLDIYKGIVGKMPEKIEGQWFLSDDIKSDKPKQRTLFEALAGPWMGKDRRRGVPYVWSISHLADGKRETSPRSFIAAIRAAVENSQSSYSSYEYAMHYESIKRGVQHASLIRIAEMAEDYPWVNEISKPLRGLNVPCDFSTIKDVWQRQNTLSKLNQRKDILLPQHFENGETGILDDCVRLGIFEKMKDGRINMPDLYRVGFGLGRRGGVKPMR